MGIATTGFILTRNKNVFDVMDKVERCLFDLVKKHSTKGALIFMDTKSSFPTMTLRPSGRSVTVRFTVGGENRDLSVFFDFDSDYSEYGDSKIIWRVNTWGRAEEIVHAIGFALQDGDGFYYCANDALSDECIKMPAPEENCCRAFDLN
jgi:hypothetical protein